MVKKLDLPQIHDNLILKGNTMDFNLEAFSTEHLTILLEAKLKKPKSDVMDRTIEAIRNELASRKDKVK
jgi:hypothetical protein